MADERTTTPVDVITRYCRYSGSVLTRGFRLADVLSDQNTGILEMYRTLTAMPGRGSREVRWKEVALRKDDILLVIPKGDYEAPVRRRNCYVKKHRYGAMIAIPGFVLSGVVHFSSHATPVTLLDENSPLPAFLGLTDVTVHGSVYELLPSQCRVAIIRRRAIESVQLTDQPLTDYETLSREEQQSLPASCASGIRPADEAQTDGPMPV